MPAGGQRRQMLVAARQARERRDRRGIGRRLRAVAAVRALPGAAATLTWWRSLRPRSRRLGAVGAAAVVIAAAGLLVWVSLSGGSAPRARQYLSFTACLLTGPGGLADAPVKPAWAGMRDASLATHAQVEYLPVLDGSTESAALPYLASLVQRHCRVVVAVGQAQVAAVDARSAKYPAVRFVVVGGHASGQNVTVADGTAATVRSSVSSVITGAVAAAG
jgi:basic membrane lipoprotein Med (substrate-binding protein (PBP1-ABC) superfamily)